MPPVVYVRWRMHRKLTSVTECNGSTAGEFALCILSVISFGGVKSTICTHVLRFMHRTSVSGCPARCRIQPTVTWRNSFKSAMIIQHIEFCLEALIVVCHRLPGYTLPAACAHVHPWLNRPRLFTACSGDTYLFSNGTYPYMSAG